MILLFTCDEHCVTFRQGHARDSRIVNRLAATVDDLPFVKVEEAQVPVHATCDESFILSYLCQAKHRRVVVPETTNPTMYAAV